VEKTARRIGTVVALTTVIVLGLIGGLTSTAQASTATTGADVQELLREYPGSTQVGPHTVMVKAGITVTSPLATVKGCQFGFLCLWSDAGWSGYRIDFYHCGFYDLGAIGFPSGGRWNDKVSSWINNQTSGTLARYYNYDGVSSFKQVYADRAYHSIAGAGDIGLNDIIDAVRPC